MLEILFLVKFCKRLAEIAREKNRPGSWGALGALFWVGGEVGGAMVGASSGNAGMGLYGYALVGAALGALIAYVIVKSLAPISTEPEFPQARVV